MVELPQRYYRFSFMIASFPAPTRCVRRLLPNDDLVAVEIAPGIAVVTLGAWQYLPRIANLDPYNEFALMVPVRYKPERYVPLLPLLQPDAFDVAFWIDYLPVTTAQARDAGIGIWGYPKVVADIKFSDVGWMHTCRLTDEDGDALLFSSAMGETRPQGRDFYTYSIRNGELLHTRIETRGQYHVWNTPGQASFELGNHPIANKLRYLEVKNLAVGGLYARGVKMRLYEGTRVAQPVPGSEPAADAVQASTP